MFFGCLDRLARPSLCEAGCFVLFDRLFKAVDDAQLTELGFDKNDTALRLEEADLAKLYDELTGPPYWLPVTGR